MTAERVAAGIGGLARRYELSERAAAQLAALLSVLERDARAPTAVREPARALDAHVADSLVALELDAVGTAHTIADVGSGAGLPGLVLAAALPDSEMRLVESHLDKCVFLRDAVAEVGIENAEVVWARAEDWEDGFGGHDLVVARAVGAQPVVLEYAAPLLRAGGALVDWRGRRSGHEEQAAMRAAAELGMRRLEIRAVTPFQGATDRHLHLFEKVAATPARFPRRPGMATKRPLGL
jgi:16S rRNA (guanine527-N7)-methyltransferase